jgi:hypothetical protein
MGDDLAPALRNLLPTRPPALGDFDISLRIQSARFGNRGRSNGSVHYVDS